MAELALKTEKLEKLQKKSSCGPPQPRISTIQPLQTFADLDLQPPRLREFTTSSITIHQLETAVGAGMEGGCG